MFGFGLKLKSKPKPIINAARRPRGLVDEASQKTDTTGQQDKPKPALDETTIQPQNSNVNKINEPDKSATTNDCQGVESLPKLFPSNHQPPSIPILPNSLDSKVVEVNSVEFPPVNCPPVHIENVPENVVNKEIDNRTPFQSHVTSDTTDSGNLIRIDNEQSNRSATLPCSEKSVTPTETLVENEEHHDQTKSLIPQNVDTCESNREDKQSKRDEQKDVPFKPKLLPRKNRFIPNLRNVGKRDDSANTSNSPQESQDPTTNKESDLADCVAVTSDEIHSDSSNLVSSCNSGSDSNSLEELPGQSQSEEVINNDLQTQLTSSEPSQSEELSTAQAMLSLHQNKSHKTSSSVLVTKASEKLADKENTICDNENQIQQKMLQNSKKKKPKSQGTFLKMTIEARKQLNDKLKNGVLDKSKLIMRDLILYNPTTNPMPVKPKLKSIKDEKKIHPECKSAVEEILSEQSVDDVEASKDSDAGSLPVPKLKVGPDGKITLDCSSLVIETTGTEKNRADLQNSELVEENEFSGFKYRKRKARRNDWSPEETILFYKALNDLGADFSLMQSLFPNRTRRDLKLKFKKEEKCNLSLVDKAMTHGGKFDFDALKEELTRDREEMGKKHAEKMKNKQEMKNEMKLMRQKAKEMKMEADKERESAKSKLRMNKLKEKNSKKKIPKKRKPPVKQCPSLQESDDNSDDNDNVDIHYDKIFKPTKFGRKPRLRDRDSEDCKVKEKKRKIPKRKALDVLRDEVMNREVEEELNYTCTVLDYGRNESVDEIPKRKVLVFRNERHKNNEVVEKEEEPLNYTKSNLNCDKEFGLFEEPENVAKANEEDDVIDPATFILNVGTRGMQQRRLPEAIKIVEELTRALPQQVQVNGVVCNIIPIGEETTENSDSSSFGVCENTKGDGSSTFKIRESSEDPSISQSFFQLEKVLDNNSNSNSEQINFVIDYDEHCNDEESLGADSQHLEIRSVDEAVSNSNLPYSDHNYCSSPGRQDQMSVCIERSFVVLKPMECVEIYNETK